MEDTSWLSSIVSAGESDSAFSRLVCSAALFSADEQGALVGISEGFLKLLGYSREQMSGNTHHLSELMEQEDCSALCRAFGDNAARTIRQECRFRTPCGIRLWGLVQGSVVETGSGPRCLCLVTDITKYKAVEEQLHICEARYRIALEQLDSLVFDLDLQHDRLILTNKEVFPCGLPSVIEQASTVLFTSGLIHPDTLAECKQMYQDLLNGNETASCTAQIRLFKDEYHWCNIRLTNIFNEQHHAIRAVGVIDDINEQRKSQERFVKEQQYREAILHNAMFIYKINLTKDRFNKGNEDWYALFGIRPTHVYSDMIRQFAAHGVHTEDKARFLHTFDAHNLLTAFAGGVAEASLEYRQKRKDGSMLWVVCTMNLVEDVYTRDVKCIAYVKDITNQKKKELDMLYRAERDSLSRLYNRGATKQHITDYLESQEGQGHQHALLLLDVDNFKQVNDSFGHIQGDSLLSHVSDCMQDISRSTDVLGRVGGDEFVFFQKNISRPEAAMRKARELNAAVRSIHFEDNPGLVMTVSIGVALFPDDGKTFDELYAHADEALYQAKADGKNTCMAYRSGKCIPCKDAQG